ncbi:hypothetical protein [Neoroseomonas soli]|uniref:Uncharacterized protein n=1 Tax=Neoroseomonas soli TaxID=1081025 RepID=A0A9X9X1H0_9PROT|nr:hypothetical protein [Neoroseomonas soli]MBR0673249.1 hypothetical protein [Neoroseomonas soli]
MADWTPPAGNGPRWIAACVVGLAVGLPLATLWNVVLLPQAMPEAGRLGMLVMLLRALAGAIAGGCLGLAQAVALMRTYPGFPAPLWIGATAAAGYAAALVTILVYGVLTSWAAGMTIATFVVIAALVTSVVSGLTYGLAQGRVLGRVVAAQGTWAWLVMLGSMLGALLGSARWLLGVTATDATSLVTGGIIGGALEGLALGLVTAGAFRVMPPRRAPRSQP